MSRLLFIFLMLAGVLCALASAADRLVPSQFATIQGAISAASNGDRVIVSPGTYWERINLQGKAITVMGTDPGNWSVVESTVINGGGGGSVVTCNGGEGSSTILDGLTLTGGSANTGGAIYAGGNSPTIRRCYIHSNSASYSGGGYYSYYGASKIENCRFANNSATYYGGAICVFCAGLTVRDCILTGNSADSGGAAWVYYSTSYYGITTFTNCTFSGNTASSYGGALDNYYSECVVTNCIMWGDSASSGPEIHDWSQIATVNYSDVQGGRAGTGNINLDPQFGGNYRLSAGSPCKDAGDPGFVPQPGEVDIDGDNRVVDGRVDMGADEVVLFNPRVHNLNTDEWFETIQAAINDAQTLSGHVLEANTGTYNENVSFAGKNLTLRSTDPSDPAVVAATIIDGGGTSASNKCVSFNAGQTNSAVLDGFTLGNAYYGAYCISASPTITRCVFTGSPLYYAVYGSASAAIVSDCVSINTYYGFYFVNGSAVQLTRLDCDNMYYGAIIYSSNASKVSNCVLHGNSSYGLYVYNSNTAIENNLVYENGTGIRLYNASATVSGCTVVNCTSYGIWCQGTAPSIENCIVWNCNDDLYQCAATYSCIQDGDAGTGNISDDPLFVDPGNDDYHIGDESPCIEAGDPAGDYSGQKDMDGERRQRGPRVDMGADETPDNIYVNCSGGGGGLGDGISWATAFDDLQDALDVAAQGDVIWVAAGTYSPSVMVNPPDPRSATFQLVAGVAIYGGFAGDEPVDYDLSRRDFSANETILSGDLNGDDLPGRVNVSENAYHILTGAGGNSTVLDGVTVRGGNAPMSDHWGSGLMNVAASPTIRYCRFEECWAESGYHGSGIYNTDNSCPVLQYCSFDGEGVNGAMTSELSDLLVINGCTFANCNQLGLETYGGHMDISNCIFANNNWGIFIDYCHPDITHCTFYGNTYGVVFDGGASMNVDNCIFWNNTNHWGSQFLGTVDYSCVQWLPGGLGVGNIGSDPMFVDAPNGDYRLALASPCVDTGTDAGVYTDIDGYVRPFNNQRLRTGDFDMGAFESRAFRFTGTVDPRPTDSGSSQRPKWRNVLDEVVERVGDEGIFHISPGDIDRVVDAYADLSHVPVPGAEYGFGPNVIWFPIAGNHEVDDADDEDLIYLRGDKGVTTWGFYQNLLNLTETQPHLVREGQVPAGTRGTTFSFDYGDAHFVVLNQYWNGASNDSSEGTRDIVDALYTWLIEDLYANDKPVVFVAAHEPAYPEFRHVNDGGLDSKPEHRDRFWKILNDRQVISYLCGHTHFYYEKQVDDGAGSFYTWDPYTWQIDLGNAGNENTAQQGTPDHNPDWQTFMDITVNEGYVQFDTWRGQNDGVDFVREFSWTEDVIEDATAPALQSASAAVATEVEVVFSEWLDEASAEDIANYAIDQGVTISAATLRHDYLNPDKDYRTVVLTTSALSSGITYTVTVDGVQDHSANLNAMSSQQAQFQYVNIVEVSFQQGAGGYSSAADTMVHGAYPTTSYATNPVITVDGSDAGSSSQVVVKFDNIIGVGAGQIPTGATVVSATLRLRSLDTGQGGNLHTMLIAWADTWTWNTFVNGVQANNIEAASVIDDSITANSANVDVDFDVTGTVQNWVNGTATNYGWVILPQGGTTNGWDIASCNHGTAADRPELIVTYQP